MHASLLPNISGSIDSLNPVLTTGVQDMTDTLEGFAQRLRELRKHKNLSQTELGQLAELHYTHIGRFERGTSRPSGDSLKRLADALSVTSDYLLTVTCCGNSKKSSNCPMTIKLLSRNYWMRF
jgi:ribosome-binding protein aMBF1 (putative translation factor)